MALISHSYITIAESITILFNMGEDGKQRNDVTLIKEIALQHKLAKRIHVMGDRIVINGCASKQLNKASIWSASSQLEQPNLVIPQMNQPSIP